MKTPKDKAKSLVEKMKKAMSGEYGYRPNFRQHTIECAKIAVEEIIDELTRCEKYKDVNPNLPISYWNEVKNELNKI